MTLEFSDVFIISETIRRSDLKDFFWPLEQRRFGRQKLIDRNKREGWICRFLDKGLLLDAKILISKSDYAEWPAQHRTQNSNTLTSELTFHEKFEFPYSSQALKVKHPAEAAEAVRKIIYVSEHFGDRADGLWAAQYFESGSDRKFMFYVLGFDREVNEKDLIILETIRSELLTLQNVEFV